MMLLKILILLIIVMIVSKIITDFIVAVINIFHKNR